MRLASLLLCLTLIGCATPASKRRQKSDLDRVIEQAIQLLGQREIRVGGQGFRSDCSGFVTAVYSAIDLPLIDPDEGGISGTHTLFRSLAKRGRIRRQNLRPGDLLFFHNTWDRNGNRLRDDRFSHVAVVESVDADGTVHFVHFASGQVKRDVLNLQHRGVAKDPDTGKTWNSHLRRGRGRVLAGQLYFKAGRPLPR